MSETNESNECMACTAMEIPEFERILDDLVSLVDRVRGIRETSVTISDALIGVQNTGEGYDDAAKLPSPPNYFVIRCDHSLNDFREEVERLEKVNTKLLHSIKVD